MAEEALAQEVNILLGPGVNIKRTPLADFRAQKRGGNQDDGSAIERERMISRHSCRHEQRRRDEGWEQRAGSHDGEGCCQTPEPRRALTAREE